MFIKSKKRKAGEVKSILPVIYPSYLLFINDNSVLKNMCVNNLW